MLNNIRYQDKAVTELLKRVDNCLDEKEREFLFKAPTGAGKTITMGKFFDAYFKKHDDKSVGFIWLSPGKGNLAGQSRDSMAKTFNNFNSISLQDMLLNREIRNKDVVFINWEAVNKKGNVSMREGEKINVKGVLENSNLDKLIIVVDESHEARNATKAMEVLETFDGDIVIDVTATPRSNSNYKDKFNVVKIEIDDVIKEGFIKKQVVLNEGLPSLDTMDVLKTAIDKRDQIEQAYKQYEKHVKTPLVLIQIENDKKVDVGNGVKKPRAELIKEYLDRLGLKDEEIAVWVSNKKQCQNLEGIKYSDVKVLIFKSAIATGYDIDRAHILVKLRDAKSEVFNAQVLGRVLRTQFKQFYDDDLVDSAYVYTEFSTYDYELDMDDDLKERLKKPRSEAYLKAKVKTDLPSFSIPMEKKLSQKGHNVDTRLLRKRILKELTSDFIASLDYDRSAITEHVKSGTLSINDMESEDYFENLTERKVVMTDLQVHRMARKSLRQLSKYIDIGQMVLSILQGDDRLKKVSDPSWFYIQHKEVINNKLIDALDAYYELRFKKATVDEMYQPLETVYYRGVQEKTSDNYAYTLEPDLSTASTKSSSEETFAAFLNQHPNVLYWYKNENNGDHFSIAYEAEDHSAALYYPDFIIITRDMKLFIVDVKAPIKGSKTQDIRDVRSKYNNGKKYEYREQEAIENAGFSDIEFSMIKLNGDTPYICVTDEYSDKFTDDDIWKVFNP